MPHLGAHQSVAGGLHKAVESAVALGCGTVQLFTKNANQWDGKPLADEDVRTFRKAAKASRLKHLTAHDSPLGTNEEYEETLAEFDRVIGLKQLKAFHLNDSVKGLGSRVDRHAAIGLGQIGEAPFRRLVTDPQFRDRPMILETPKYAA